MHLEDMVNEIVMGFLLFGVICIGFLVLVEIIGWALRKLGIVR